MPSPTEVIEPEDRTTAVDAMTSAPARLEILDSQQRDRALAIWTQVEQSLRNPPLHASRNWTETWLNHFGDLVPHRFVLWQVDSRYRGVALLTAGVGNRIGIWNERAWHLGTAGEPDADSVCIEYNALLCPAGLREPFLRDLLQHLETENGWDAGRLDGFAQDELPEAIFEDPRWQVTTKMARWVDLNEIRASGRELLSFFGDSTRKNIRQNARKLDDLRFECADTVEHALHIFEDLITLHQSRWNSVGQPGCYASERFTAFHRELISRLAPEQMLLARLSTRDAVVGCTQVLIDRGRALVYQGGRLETAPGSPGLITDFLMMQECLARGYSAYDFMAGDSIHKRRLTTHTTPLCWATSRRPRWKYRLLDACRAGRDQYRNFWKSRTGQQVTSAAKNGSEMEVEHGHR